MEPLKINLKFIFLKKKERLTTMMLLRVYIMLWLHGCFGLSLYVIPKQTLQELKGFQRVEPPFQDEHLERARTSWLAPISPQGKPLGSHMVD